MAQSPEKEEIADIKDIEKEEKMNEVPANDEIEIQRMQTNQSSRKFTVVRSTTFGVENSNMQNLVNQINKDKKKADDVAPANEWSINIQLIITSINSNSGII